jgi:hypothetical protein
MCDEDEVLRVLSDALARRRGYADGRSWPLDRQREERGIVEDFLSGTIGEAGAPFTGLRSLARGEDPPDCEFWDSSGRLIGIELTELVDADAIKRKRWDRSAAPAEWAADTLIDSLSQFLTRKDNPSKPPKIAYHEYFLIVHTNEPRLYIELAEEWLRDHLFPTTRLISRAFLLFDYHPGIGYRFTRLRIAAANGA